MNGVEKARLAQPEGHPGQRGPGLAVFSIGDVRQSYAGGGEGGHAGSSTMVVQRAMNSLLVLMLCGGVLIVCTLHTGRSIEAHWSVDFLLLLTSLLPSIKLSLLVDIGIYFDFDSTIVGRDSVRRDYQCLRCH